MCEKEGRVAYYVSRGIVGNRGPWIVRGLICNAAERCAYEGLVGEYGSVGGVGINKDIEDQRRRVVGGGVGVGAHHAGGRILGCCDQVATRERRNSTGRVRDYDTV